MADRIETLVLMKFFPSVSAFLILLALPALAQKRIAITIDDLPYVGTARTLENSRSATERTLAALKDAKAPAIGFVNERWVQVDGERDARTALLKEWLDAGMTLGNHTYSHADLNAIELAVDEDEVIKGEVITRDLMRARGHKTFYFRYPFNHTGGNAEKKAAFQAFLAARGYTLAPFTVEHSDYWFNELYGELLARGDMAQAEKVRQVYLDYLPVQLEYFEKLSTSYFGREIAQILLIHLNDINAKSLPAMLATMKQRGYAFISLDEALKDEAYRTPDLYVGNNGISWLHRWSVALKKPMDLRNEPDPPKWVFDLKKSLMR